MGWEEGAGLWENGSGYNWERPLTYMEASPRA